MVTKGIEAMMKRFDAGMQQGISADVYSSRMASYTGTSSAKNFKNQGKNGFGFLATDFVQGNEVQYQGTGIGAYVGAGGRPGQWGQAYTTSIRQAQELMPGLDASQAGNIQTSIYSNVQGIKLGQALLGRQASPYKSDGTGERKTQDEYFRDILNGLQRRPRTGGRPGGAWTKEDIMKQNFPGSRLNLTLATILPEDAIPAWFDWAINNAAAGGNLSTDPTQERKQLESVRGGRSLATNAQETTNREAQKDATFAGQQYGAMNARLDYEKKMLDALQSIDTTLRHAYGATGRVPSLLQGLAANVAGGLVGGLAAGLLAGDPGYMPMGDPPAQPAFRSGSRIGRTGQPRSAFNGARAATRVDGTWCNRRPAAGTHADGRPRRQHIASDARPAQAGQHDDVGQSEPQDLVGVPRQPAPAEFAGQGAVRSVRQVQARPRPGRRLRHPTRVGGQERPQVRAGDSGALRRAVARAVGRDDNHG
jgi:hypothetical protein